MLVVKTKLGLSKLNDIGLFADQDIPKGTIIWKNNPELSFIKFSQEEWNRRERELSEESFQQIKKRRLSLKRVEKSFKNAII